MFDANVFSSPSPNVSRGCGVNIVMTTITFDKEALTGSNDEQPAAPSGAAERKSVPAGRCGVTSPLLTAILEHADTACDTVKEQTLYQSQLYLKKHLIF